MTKHLKTAVLCLGLATLLLHIPISAAQQPKPAPLAPIPAQILTAAKIFIANGGGDESRDEGAAYTGRTDRAYNEFYAAMKTWGRYELVASPTDADLVFEISLTVFQLQRERVMEDNASAYDPQLRLVIRDAKTHQTLWGLTEHPQTAVLKNNRDNNFEQAMAAIVTEAKRIAGPGRRGPGEELACVLAENYTAKRRKLIYRELEKRPQLAGQSPFLSAMLACASPKSETHFHVEVDSCPGIDRGFCSRPWGSTIR
jgi:hypothetical protein